MEEGDWATWISKKRAFETDITSAKALRWEYVQNAVRRSLWHAIGEEGVVEDEFRDVGWVREALKAMIRASVSEMVAFGGFSAKQ